MKRRVIWLRVLRIVGSNEPLATVPTALGSYILKAIVTGTLNYNASEKSTLFAIVNPDNAFEIVSNTN